jgi:DNA ligase (NAD+)
MQAKYNQLVDQINRLDRAYWVDNKSSIPDAVYDRLVQQVLQMEQTPGLQVRPDSPSQRRAGALTQGFVSRKHVKPMLSLEKCFDLEDLKHRVQTMATDTLFIIEPKIDGLSVDLRYDNGHLTQALTGGTGVEGDDVTANIRTLRSVPLFLDFGYGEVPKVLHIRGEVHITFVDFQRMNERRTAAGLPLLANPRNAASGSLKLLDPMECARRPLRFTPYQIAYATGWLPREMSRLTQMSYFNDWGFAPLQPYFEARTPDEVAEMILKFEALRKNLPYPTDGAVVKLDSLLLQQRLGDGPVGPRWAFAYKYAPDQIETKLRGITVQVGKTGVLAPVAELEPVWLAGSTVARASLHNEAYILDLGLKIGDTVTIAKAGEIIPEVQSVLVGERTGAEIDFTFPKSCPRCGTRAIRQTNTDGEKAAAWVCPNKQCPDQIKGRLLHWCSKGCLNIESLGPVGIADLVDRLMLDYPNQLYTLTRADLEKAGITGVTKVLSEIERSRSQSLERVLHGLCIPRIGETLSKKLARIFPKLWAVCDSYGTEITPASLPPACQELGPVANQTLIDWFHDMVNVGLCERLQAQHIGERSDLYRPGGGTGPMSGMVFVVTGELASMEREKAHALIEERGGRTTGSVSKKTTHLVVGTEPGNNKLQSAKKHGTKQLNEAEFLKMLEQT